MKNTANISLPPIIACGKNSLYCKDYCYAKNFYNMYPEVKKAWDDNLEELSFDRNFYFQSIRRYLLKKRPEYFRWHTSGDIIDQDYLEQMKIIAKDYDFTNFLVFTKQYYLNFIGTPYNLCIVLSIWPDLEVPDKKMPLAFVDFENETRGKDSFKCPESCEECRACWFLKYGKNVLLNIKRR